MQNDRDRATDSHLIQEKKKQNLMLEKKNRNVPQNYINAGQLETCQ